MKAPVNTKTRKPENAKTGGINLWTRKQRKRENGENAKTAKTRKPRKRGKRENAKTAKTRKRENGENAKTAKTRKPRKRGKRENGENPKTRKRRKRRKPENGQKCSCFLVFNFSFSGFLGFLGFLVFSFSGFLVPLAASFWPGRVFYVLSISSGLRNSSSWRLNSNYTWTTCSKVRSSAWNSKKERQEGMSETNMSSKSPFGSASHFANIGS